MTRPRCALRTATGAARSVRPLAKSDPMPTLEAMRRESRTRLTARVRSRRPPPFRAQQPLRLRARNLGEAGSAQARRAEHCTVGATPIKCTGNRTEGSNPSLSAAAPSQHEGVRRWHPSLLATLTGGCGAPTSPKDRARFLRKLRAAGGGRQAALERCANQCDGVVEVTQHELRIQADDAIAEPAQLAITTRVRGPAARVIAAIHFDDERNARSEEIHDEATAE